MNLVPAASDSRFPPPPAGAAAELAGDDRLARERGADAFLQHRAQLFGLAYRMLGMVAEAEDVVQEVYLRWQKADRSQIDSARAWLTAATTRLCIDHLRSARYRRENYVGVWLPEPLVDESVGAPDAVAAMADSLRMAFLVVLEELSPVERAVFLLREAFDYEYAEIGAIVGKSEVNCRQIFRRARTRLAERPAAENAAAMGGPAVEQAVQRFVRACTHGELGDFLELLSANAMLYTDGGGRVRSALRPIRTADHIGRFFIGIRRRGFAGARMTPVQVNGEPGLLIDRLDGHRMVAAFALEGEHIRAIYMVTNPDKLRHLRIAPAPAPA